MQSTVESSKSVLWAVVATILMAACAGCVHTKRKIAGYEFLADVGAKESKGSSRWMRYYPTKALYPVVLSKAKPELLRKGFTLVFENPRASGFAGPSQDRILIYSNGKQGTLVTLIDKSVR